MPEDRNTAAVWLSTDRAAKRIGITTRTLLSFIKSGSLPAYRFGRVIRLKQSDVDAYIERCRIKPEAPAHDYSPLSRSA